MKQTINFSQFCDAFRAHDRQDQFSYEGKRVLFESLQDYEDSTGEQIELDVIALCCEFDEYTADELVDLYNIDLEGVNSDNVQQAVEEFIQDRTFLCGITSTGNIVFQSF